MQRLLIALMAIGSLLMSNPAVLRAQDEGKAVDPAGSPHMIDEPAAPLHTGPSSRSSAVENVLVHNVTQNEPHAADRNSGSYAPPQTAASNGDTREMRKQHSWFGSQLALLILGLLGAGLAVVTTPKATRRVSDHVSAHVSQDFIVGGLVGVALLVILVVNAILLKLPLIKMMWAPIGIMVAFAPLLILGFGWLAAMRCAGDYVASKIKLNHSGEGSSFGRISLGLFAFFFLNVLLGSISRGLGVIGLCTEIAVALMGLGATVVIASGSGFGRRA